MLEVQGCDDGRIQGDGKYDELEADKGTVDGEWRQYKDAFVGVAEEQNRAETLFDKKHI